MLNPGISLDLECALGGREHRIVAAFAIGLQIAATNVPKVAFVLF